MGACLDPTPAMRRYRVEMRNESFILTRTYASSATRVTRFAAALPAPDVHAVLAALEQVTTHPQWDRWDRMDRPDDPTAWTADPDGAGETAGPDWRVTLDVEELSITGPWVVSHERDLWSAEIAYRDTEALQTALCKTLALG